MGRKYDAQDEALDTGQSENALELAGIRRAERTVNQILRGRGTGINESVGRKHGTGTDRNVI